MPSPYLLQKHPLHWAVLLCWVLLAVQDKDNAPFVDRVQVLRAAVAQPETGAAALAATPVSADFIAKVGPGIDLVNTTQALIARYSLLAGEYDKALAAAGCVDLTKRSAFNYDEITRNPLSDTTFGTRNLFEPTDANLGLTGALAPDPTDRRLPFFLRSNPAATQNRGSTATKGGAAPVLCSIFSTPTP